jgi:hypothetical protein
MKIVIQIMLFPLFWRETWALNVGEEHIQCGWEQSAGIFGTKEVKVAGQKRRET